MDLRRTGNNILQIVFSLVLGGAILYWMYRGFDLNQVRNAMQYDMDWTWMLLSLPFGVTAQMFRGLRWCQTLDPIGEHARKHTAVNAIFLSYATSLVIPRVGEFLRCGVLKRYDGVAFPKALGTVVTERAVDAVVVAAITLTTILLQLSVFTDFFTKTGTRIDTLLTQFTSTGYLVTAICLVAAVALVAFLLRKMAIYNKVKDTLHSLWAGVMSVRKVERPWLYIAYTLLIWGSYFLHFYLTFFCFEQTAHLGVDCALVAFVVGSIAVIVPTPNGAGPWHFSVKTMLILYGVASDQALSFVLIVHTLQTLLVVALGLYAWAALSMTRRRTAPVGTAE